MKKLILASLTFLTVNTYAFQCYTTLAKSNCWTNYEVSVSVIDASTEKTLLEIVAPKGQSWVRLPFECQPGTKLNYKATFSPTVWENEANKIYSALRYWSLPDTIAPNVSAWDIPLCFPDAFSEVPMPSNDTGHCMCDMKSIPPLLPKTI